MAKHAELPSGKGRVGEVTFFLELAMAEVEEGAPSGSRLLLLLLHFLVVKIWLL
jgi:hypothetical protein